MSNSAPQFGVADGIVTTAVGNSDDHGHSVTIQPDGKLIVAGLSFNGVNSEVALVRYNVDGKLDTTFGGGDGIVTAPIGSLVGSSSVTVQPDGRIVIVGSNGEFAIVRYNADGTLDTSFGGGDGIVTTIIGDSGDHAFSVALQADGRIIVAGTSLRVSAYGSNYDFALVRYNADGTLDTSFGAGDGFVTTPIPSSYTLGPSITSVTVQLDGKIVVAGYGRFGSTEEAEDFAVVRYNADGTLDTSFGDGDGIVTTPIGSWSDESHSVTLQPDGRIIVAGYSRNGASYDIALVRYNVDGTLDTAFGGGDGIVTTPIGSLAFGYSVTLQPDAKIVVAGVTLDGSNADIALIRYDNDGSLDTSFGGGDGIVTTAIGASGDYANSVALQPDGKIVVAGTSLIGDTYDFAVVRYNADGSLDTTFDSVGSVVRAVAYTEDGSAVIVDGGAQVFDAELAAQGHYDGATLTLARAGGANADDVFAATGNLVLSAGDVILSGVTIGTVTNTGGTLAITFNADATQTRVDEAMRWITYANNSDGPPASLDILWTFNDGNTGSQGTGGALETTDTVTVNITGVNDAPNVASPIADQSVAEDTAWSFSVPANTFTDPDSVLTYTASLANDDPLPAWLNFDAGTQTFSGTPPQDFNGVISLKVTASDGTESVSDTFDLTVTPENDPPVAVDDTASGAENAVVSLNVLTNDTDVDTGDSKTLVSLTALTAGDVSGLGALSAGDLALLDSYFSFAGDGTVTLTPGAGLPGGAESLFDRLDPGQQATVSLTYTVEDGSGAQDTGTVVFTISGARELINGTTGDDPSLTGTPYADLVTGLAGNDILSGGAGSDILDGGEGTDTADYSAETSAVNVFLFNVANFGGDIGLASLTAGVTSGSDYLKSIENVIGGASADFLYGDAGANRIEGRDGGDRIDGREGNDTLHGDAGADLITGGAGDDTIYGGADTDTFLLGEAGMDTIHGDDGDDRIDGGADNDTLYGDAGADFITGGLGDDTIYGGSDTDTFLLGEAGMDTIHGDDGDDRIYGGADNDTLYGDAGADRITGNIGDDTIYGGDGDDQYLLGEAGNDTIYGGLGVDFIGGGADDDFLYGDEGNDAITGGLGNDTIEGGADNDALYGEDGNDTIRGGDGSDLVAGGVGDDILLAGDDGNDYILGGDGNDTIDGGGDNDVLYGEAGADTIWGGLGADQIYGGADNDTIDGGEDADYIVAGLGDDIIDGGDGNDILIGEDGADTISGGSGADQIYSGADNDTIDGGGDADYIVAGLGDDVIDGGAGNDTIFGEGGTDTFKFSDGWGHDTIHDWLNGTEQLDLSAVTGLDNFGQLTIYNIAGGVQIFFGGNTITLSGWNTTHIDASDFIF